MSTTQVTVAPGMTPVSTTPSPVIDDTRPPISAAPNLWERIAITPPRRRYRGRRARRAAFAYSQRCRRVLQRVARELGPAYNERMSGAWRDMLVHGMGWLTVGPGTPIERNVVPTEDPGVVRVVDTYRR